MSLILRPQTSTLPDERAQDWQPTTTPWPLRLLGTLWRWGVGVALCMNYFTSVLVVGWLARRMRSRTVGVWWQRSPRAQTEESFLEFCAETETLPTRPRWILSDGDARIWLGSIWENAKVGVRILAGTIFLMGWGAVLVWLGWEFGWHNSFHKGYEQAFFGIAVSLVGFALFAWAMIYVPMAQAHCAVTRELRSFLDFRFIGALIRARMTSYVLLAAVTAIISLPLLVMRIMPQFFAQMNPAFETATDVELLRFMRGYLLAQSALLFFALMMLRNWAARIYGAAVWEVIRRGQVRTTELHPEINAWFRRLHIDPGVTLSSAGWLHTAKASGGWIGRRVGFTLLFVIWIAFLFAVLTGEFFNYHPIQGFLNHPLIQLPCPDIIPAHLSEAG